MARFIRLMVGNLGPVPPPGFILGVTIPQPANTGLNVQGLTTANLAVINGDLTINDSYVAANGSVLDRKYFKGFVNYTATTPVTISNSYVEGRTFTGDSPREALIRARNGSAPLNAKISLVNTIVKPIQPDVGITCVAGERLGLMDRSHFENGSDGIDYWAPSPPNVRGCYFGPFSFWDDDPKHTTDGSHPGWSHNDHIQNSASDGGIVIGCYFDIRAAVGVGNVSTLTAGGFPLRDWGTGIMLTPSGGTITNFVAQDNWLGYGRNPIMLPFQSSGSFNSGNSWTVFGNKCFALPSGYGTGNTSRHFISWNQVMGPPLSSVFSNSFTNDTTVPLAFRGTNFPATISQGSGNSAEYIVKVTS
jgi:hypothetical protein